MSESTMMYENMHEGSVDGMQAFITMKNQKRIYEEDNNLVQEMPKPHKRVRITDVEGSRDEQGTAPKQTNRDDKCTRASVIMNDKLCKRKPFFFLPLKGKDIKFLHLHHPESGDLEKVMFAANPPRVRNTVHMPVYSGNPPQQPRDSFPQIEVLRGSFPPTLYRTGSSDINLEVNRMAHRAYLTYDYWFFNVGQEHLENDEDEDAPNTKMEPFNYNPWSPPPGYSREPPY